MTTLENRPNTALLVIDVQAGVVEGAYERDAVVANVASLVDRARREGISVVWVQHSDEQLSKGSDAWRIVPELNPGEGEPVVEKHYGDSFEDTRLEGVLADLTVGRIVVVGAQTDACIRSTLHGAFVRGYDATLVSDAHTTEDQSEWGAPPPEKVIAHTNLYWRYQSAPGRTAGTVETKDVDFNSPSSVHAGQARAKGPRPDQLNLVVANMDASVAFYRRLGLSIPDIDPAWQGHHRTVEAGDGVVLDLDSEEFARRWNGGWDGERVVIGFKIETRQGVDELYEDLTHAGHPGQQEPYDAFWGARYAVVGDPDGNPVGLMSRVDPARRSDSGFR